MAAGAAAAEEAPTLVRVKEIRVNGNVTTARRIILRYCDFKEGDLLTPAELDRRLAQTRKNLVKTQFFLHVNVFDLPRTNPAEAVIMVDVSEGPTWHFSASTTQAKLTKENVGGRSVALGVEGGLERQRLSYDQRWTFGWPWRTSLAAFYENGHETILENGRGYVGEWYHEEAVGGEGAWGYLPTSAVEFGAGVRAEDIHYYDYRVKARPFPRYGVRDRATLVALQPYAEWDGRDNSLYPSRGVAVRLDTELTSRRLSVYEYGGAALDVRAYVTPAWKLVVAERVYVAAATDGMPYIRWYNIRGSEGLRSVNCYTTVGTKALLSSTELRRQLFPSPLFTGWLEGVLFCDVGRTWDAGEAARGRDFGVAFGPGIRVHMKQPLYFDWRAELNVIGDLAFYASARRGF